MGGEGRRDVSGSITGSKRGENEWANPKNIFLFFFSPCFKRQNTVEFKRE